MLHTPWFKCTEKWFKCTFKWLERVTLPLHSCHAPSFTLARTGEVLSCGRGFLKPGEHRFISGRALVNKHPGFLHLVGPLLQLLHEYYCRNLQDKETHRVTRAVVTEIPPLPTLPFFRGRSCWGQQKGEAQTPWAGLRAAPCPGHAWISVWCLAAEQLNAEFPVQAIVSGESFVKPHSGQY